MYFAGKLVYLIVLPSNQLAITGNIIFSLLNISFFVLKASSSYFKNQLL